MKALATFIFSAFLFVVPVVAQHTGHSGGSHSSGSSGSHAGTGHTGPVVTHNGSGGNPYRGPRTVIVPYAYPVFGYGSYGSYGAPPAYGYADPGASYAAPPPPNDSMNYIPQPDPPPPPDAVSQPDDSGIHRYESTPPTPQEQAMSEGRYYLIAYKDHSVYTALAYWVENGALNYVTPQNAHNQVSLDLLDLDYTKQLNARRGLGFNLVRP